MPKLVQVRPPNTTALKTALPATIADLAPAVITAGIRLGLIPDIYESAMGDTLLAPPLA